MPKGGKRPGAGRKKLPPGQKRTLRTMMATDEEWQKIKEFAADLKRPKDAQE